MLHMNAQPFRNKADNFIGTAVNFSLAMMLFSVLVLKMGVRREVEACLTAELLALFSFDEVALTGLLLFALFFSLGLALALLAINAATATTGAISATPPPTSPSYRRSPRA